MQRLESVLRPEIKIQNTVCTADLKQEIDIASFNEYEYLSSNLELYACGYVKDKTMVGRENVKKRKNSCRCSQGKLTLSNFNKAFPTQEPEILRLMLQPNHHSYTQNLHTCHDNVEDANARQMGCHIVCTVV